MKCDTFAVDAGDDAVHVTGQGVLGPGAGVLRMIGGPRNVGPVPVEHADDLFVTDVQAPQKFGEPDKRNAGGKDKGEVIAAKDRNRDCHKILPCRSPEEDVCDDALA